MPIKKRHARFIFERPDDYEPVYVNGVYGGITPRGELLAHFFLEYADTPLEESVSIDKSGKIEVDKVTQIIKGQSSEGEKVYRRDMRVGLIIPIHQVHSIANWMIDKLKGSHIEIEDENKNVPEGE